MCVCGGGHHGRLLKKCVNHHMELIVNTRSKKDVPLGKPPGKIVFADNDKSKGRWTFSSRKIRNRNVYRYYYPAGVPGERYSPAGDRVAFDLHTNPSGNVRQVVVENLYFSNPKRHGNIPARALLNSLKRMGKPITLSDSSMLLIDDPSSEFGPWELPRRLLPDEHDLYSGFSPAYGHVNVYSGENQNMLDLQQLRRLVKLLLKGDLHEQQRSDLKTKFWSGNRGFMVDSEEARVGQEIEREAPVNLISVAKLLDRALDPEHEIVPIKRKFEPAAPVNRRNQPNRQTQANRARKVMKVG